MFVHIFEIEKLDMLIVAKETDQVQMLHRQKLVYTFWPTFGCKEQAVCFTKVVIDDFFFSKFSSESCVYYRFFARNEIWMEDSIIRCNEFAREEHYVIL